MTITTNQVIQQVFSNLEEIEIRTMW